MAGEQLPYTQGPLCQKFLIPVSEIPKPARIVNEEYLEWIRTLKCLVCKDARVDAAHVKSRGAGGGDVPGNVMPLCRYHHSIQHRVGIYSFFNMFPEVERWLKNQ